MFHKGLNKKIHSISIILVAVLAVLLSSCGTLPTTLQLNPNIHEDEDVKIEYNIGANVNYIKITNKTDSEIFIDEDRSSIISHKGQTNNLNLSADDTHIPPKSHIVFSSFTETFFETDIETFEKEEVNRDLARYGERDYLENFLDEKIRLFLPLQINGEEKIYDIKLTVEGIIEK